MLTVGVRVVFTLGTLYYRKFFPTPVFKFFIMKMYLFSTLSIMIVFLLSSCGSDDIQDQQQNGFIPIVNTKGEVVDYAAEDEFRLASEDDLDLFYQRGWLEAPQSNTVGSRAVNCEWADGQFGSINCDGGQCRVVFHNNPDGSQVVGIGCYINSQISHAGAFRPI